MNALLELGKTGIQIIEDPTQTEILKARRTCHSELMLDFPTEGTAFIMAPLLIEFINEEKQITVVVHQRGSMLHIFFPSPTDSDIQAVRSACRQIKGSATMFTPYNLGMNSDVVRRKWRKFVESKQAATIL